MPKTTFNRRLSYTLLLALAVHAFAVFAVGFTGTKPTQYASTIEVTLAQYKAPDSVADADFFAQMDQQGSGTAKDKKHLSLTTTDIAKTTPKQSAKALSQASSASLEQQPIADPSSSATASTAQFTVVATQQSTIDSPVKQVQNTRQHSLNQPNISEQIASLKSAINSRQEKMARAPKVRTISTVSTKSHQDAEYLENWRRKIVNIGNSHYPKAADEQKIYGRVRLLIAMQADGNIKSLEVLESSGKRILDISAIKIIKLAAPFQPFSTEMRKNTDVLEIIRTIEFEKTTLIY